MLVMPANNGKWQVHYWQGLYGGLGHLYGPGRTFAPMPHLPYALDNGAFPAWTNGTEWDEESFLLHVERAAVQLALGNPPRWIVAPDVVTDAKATLARWPAWREVIESRGLVAALAVQDGMTIEVVKELDPAVIFVGGSTEWKWLWLERWCAAFPRVHVGRVNTHKWLTRCHNAGAESCDGTGWFRGRREQLEGLRLYLEQQSQGLVPADRGLFADD